jgi:hypothetical protein
MHTSAPSDLADFFGFIADKKFDSMCVRITTTTLSPAVSVEQHAVNSVRQQGERGNAELGRDSERGPQERSHD